MSHQETSPVRPQSTDLLHKLLVGEHESDCDLGSEDCIHVLYLLRYQQLYYIL